METFIVSYCVGENKYWAQIQADTAEEAKQILINSLSIISVEKVK